MAIGRKTGGRKAGTPNRDKRTVQEICAAYGYDPIEAMITVAQNAMRQEKPDLALAGKMAAHIAEYVYPKKKAVEHSGEGGGVVEWVFRSVLDEPYLARTDPSAAPSPE